MGLHGLSSVTIGVPNVTETAAYYADFGLTPEEAVAGATRVAARALGREADIGTLEVGKRADFALWRIDRPAELCYNLGANPCAGVVYRGRGRTQERRPG